MLDAGHSEGLPQPLTTQAPRNRFAAAMPHSVPGMLHRSECTFQKTEGHMPAPIDTISADGRCTACYSKRESCVPGVMDAFPPPSSAAFPAAIMPGQRLEMQLAFLQS